MEDLNELTFECSEYQSDMEEYITSICLELNKLKSNCPEIDLSFLITNLYLLIKYCDSVLVDNVAKQDKLDTSMKETVLLSKQLSNEKKQRELELNQSFHLHKVEIEGKLSFKKQVEDLEDKLRISKSDCDSLLVNNNNLLKELNKVRHLNESLVVENSNKDSTISKLKINLNIAREEISDLETNKSWGKDKWVDDTTLNAYFSAMEENIARNDILFLGPSITLTLKFGTPDSCLEVLKLTSYLDCNYVFLCLSDCSVTNEEDGGSHWSLLFINKVEKKAYHFDSVHLMNRSAAIAVAGNLGLDDVSRVIEMPCIQQRQNFECGIHVLANAKYIAYHYCVSKTYKPFSDWFSQADIGTRSSNDSSSLLSSPVNTNEAIQKTSNKWNKVPNNNKKTKKTKCLPAALIQTKNTFQILEQHTFINDSQNCSNNNIIKNINVSYDKTDFKKNTSKKCLKPQTTCIKDKKSNQRLTIASDSQGRNLGAYLEQINEDRYKIFNFCQPGADIKPLLEYLKKVTDIEMYTKNDCIVLIGGTNNIPNNYFTDKHKQRILFQYRKCLENDIKALEHTNLVLSTVPYRYDLASGSKENNLIKEINSIVRQLAYDTPHVQLLDLYLLQSYYHTRHGLHINKNGKKFVAREIIKITDSFKVISQVQPVMKHSLKATRRAKSEVNKVGGASSLGPQWRVRCSDDTVSFSEPIPHILANSIQVTEASIIDSIEKYHDDPQVAFAHCISGDFDNPKQMSRGVAVIFRNEFGRPSHSDCLNEYLTVQHGNNRATVYGLVTKKVFSSKPTTHDYDQAFSQLIRDICNKKLKLLICSPMGCVRDQIPPREFARNIVKLHKKTGASVNIVVSQERASRTLRNGLTHRELVDTLRRIIVEELSMSSAADVHQTLHSPPSTDDTKQREGDCIVSGEVVSERCQCSSEPHSSDKFPFKPHLPRPSCLSIKNKQKNLSLSHLRKKRKKM